MTAVTRSELARILQLNSVVGDRAATAAQIGISFLPRRDYNSILGYIADPQFSDYLALFERGDIAMTVIAEPARATWSKPPIIRDGNSLKTPFVLALNALAAKIGLWSRFAEADIDSGIGRFAILVLGIEGTMGGFDLSRPVKDGSGIPNGLSFARSYHEGFVSKIEIDTKLSSPTYGKPILYYVDLDDKNKGVAVHASRIVHFAEGARDDIYGQPRLKVVLDRIEDVRKIAGGSAEASWNTVDMGRVFDISPEYAVDEEDTAAFREQIDEYRLGMRRFLQTRGVTVTDLGSHMIDPRGVFEIEVKLIASSTRIPMRILIGSEAGQLASTQDEGAWSRHVNQRRVLYAEPRILFPFLRRMVSLGILPMPTSGIDNVVVEWPPIFEQTQLETAQVARTFSAAMRIVGSPEGQLVMTPEEFRHIYLKLPPLEESDADNPEVPADIETTET